MKYESIILETKPLQYDEREAIKKVAYPLIRGAHSLEKQIHGWLLLITAHYWRSLQSAITNREEHTYFEQYAAHYLSLPHLRKDEVCEATSILYKRYKKWFGSSKKVRVIESYWERWDLQT